jgi:hypothetical protein
MSRKNRWITQYESITRYGRVALAKGFSAYTNGDSAFDDKKAFPCRVELYFFFDFR